MASRKNQSTDAANSRGVNAGVAGDFRSPYQEYPVGQAQHDDVAHFTGIGEDVFQPKLTKTGSK